MCGHHGGHHGHHHGHEGTNCQCDGNCQCGKVVAPGIVSCADCGWKPTKMYNALSNEFVYPYARVESSFNSNNVKPNNTNKMNNQNPSKFPAQGIVALSTGLPGGLMWGNNTPLGNENGNSESSFDPNFATDISQQSVVGFGIGQDWVPMYSGAGNPGESGYTFGEKLKSAFVRFSPHGILIRDSFCGKYCKALGYMRSADKNAFKRCKAACKVNYINARNGKWTYPNAPEGAESGVSPAELAAMSEKEVASMPKDSVDQAARNVAAEEGSTPAPAPAKSNTMMYVIIGAVALIIIVAIIMLMMRRKQAAA